MYRLLDNPTSWETVAACQVIQAQGQSVLPDGRYDALYDACDILDDGLSAHQRCLSFAGALRAMGTRVEPYWKILAEANELPFVPDTPLHLNRKTSDANKILLCPYGPDAALNLNHNVWKYITKSLRSYGCDVMMMGDVEQRMDSCAFLENETLGGLPLVDKLQHIASATLLVGVPNAWLWLGIALGKQTICLYPDNVPQQRWLWQYGEHVARLQYEHDKVQIPILLTGVRKAIAAL